MGAGAAEAINKIITSGIMIGASNILGRALVPVEMAVGNWHSYVAACGTFFRTNELSKTFRGGVPRLLLTAPQVALSLEYVAAVPPNRRRPVVKAVSFSLALVEALGVIGHRGAGKSSVARLLVGIWQPASGLDRLDGADNQA